jgi:hypothetical protein
MESQHEKTDAPGLRASEDYSKQEFPKEDIVVVNDKVETSPVPEEDFVVMSDKVEASPVPEEDTYNGFWQREAKRMARIPRIYLGAASLISIVLSVVVRSLV